MRRRPDVDVTIDLSMVSNASIQDCAIAQLIVRQNIAGPFVITRSSITEDMEFEHISFDGPGVFSDIEVLGRLRFNRSTISAPIVVEDSILRDAVTFFGSTIQKPLLFTRCELIDRLDLERVAATDVIKMEGNRHQNTVSLHLGTFTGGIHLESGDMRGLELDGADVSGPLKIEKCEFREAILFQGAKFSAPVTIADCVLHDNLDFTAITCDRLVLKQVTVRGDASFRAGQYRSSVSLRRGSFERETVFDGALFNSRVSFEGVTFHGACIFDNATFHGPVLFRDVVFKGPVSFRNSAFTDGVTFQRVRFEAATDLEATAEQVLFDQVHFASEVGVHLSSRRIYLQRTEFKAPAKIGSADVRDRGMTPPPAVLSLLGTDATNLVVGEADISRCHLLGAYNLDKLRIEQLRPFISVPSGWRVSRSYPFLARWTGRGAIIEEHLWRASHEKGARALGWIDTDEVGVGPQLDAAQIAHTYRALRMGREEGKDEPGAADFYFGEMDMRRRATRSRAEKITLWLYWIVCGYGLRSSRALTTLGLLIAVATVVLAWWGFAEEPAAERMTRIESNGAVVYERPPSAAAMTDYGVGLRTSLESATFFRGRGTLPLTGVGQATDVTLKLLGPGLLGLAVFSLRGRVKR